MAVTIRLEHLRKTYDMQTALADLSTEFYEGQIVALLGENGAGKSTLLNMMSGFLAPSAGNILIMGENKFDIEIFPNLILVIYHRPNQRIPYKTSYGYLKFKRGMYIGKGVVIMGTKRKEVTKDVTFGMKKI